LHHPSHSHKDGRRVRRSHRHGERCLATCPAERVSQEGYRDWGVTDITHGMAALISSTVVAASIAVCMAAYLALIAARAVSAPSI